MIELIEDTVAYSDGMQNAWSGLASFKGQYYLTFRNAQYHTAVRSHILMVTSSDGCTWSPPVGFPTLDFLNYWHDNCQMYTFRDRLFLRVASLFQAPVGPQLVGQATVFSDDGDWWSEPDYSVPIGFLNWGTAEFEERLYGIFNPRNSMGTGVIAVSDDGLKWETIAPIYKSSFGLAITSAGEVFTIGVSAATKGKRGVVDRLFHSRFPFTSWDDSPLGVDIHAPFLAVINDRVVMAGRVNHEKHMVYEFGPQTAVFEFDGERFVEQFRLPPSYDCGYNGIVPSLENPAEALISDYRGYRIGAPPNRWYPNLVEERDGVTFARYEGDAVPAQADIHALRARVS
jgi:hypothetical protein